MCIQPRGTGCFRTPFKGKSQQKYILQVHDTRLWVCMGCKTCLQTSLVLVACSTDGKVISPILKSCREYLLCMFMKWTKHETAAETFWRAWSCIRKVSFTAMDSWVSHSDELNISWAGSDWFEINSIPCSEDQLVFSITGHCQDYSKLLWPNVLQDVLLLLMRNNYSL